MTVSEDKLPTAQVVIAQRVVKRRVELGYTTEFVARHINYDHKTYESLENGAERIPPGALVSLCEILKTLPSYFLSGFSPAS